MSGNDPDPGDLAQQYVDGWNERDASKLVNLFSSTITWDGKERTRDDLAESNNFAAWWEAFTDFQLDLDRIVVDGREAAFRFTMTGSHEGQFLGLKPTGETIEVSEMIMISVDNEGINELWFEWDELGFYSQLESIEHPLG